MKQKSLRIKDCISSLGKGRKENKKIEFVKYLELSQGAGQLVT